MPTRGRGRALQVEGMPTRGNSWSHDEKVSRHWESVNTRTGKDTRWLGRLRLGCEHVGSGKQFVCNHMAHDLYFYLNYTLVLVYDIYYFKQINSTTHKHSGHNTQALRTHVTSVNMHNVACIEINIVMSLYCNMYCCELVLWLSGILTSSSTVAVLKTKAWHHQH